MFFALAWFVFFATLISAQQTLQSLRRRRCVGQITNAATNNCDKKLPLPANSNCARERSKQYAYQLSKSDRCDVYELQRCQTTPLATSLLIDILKPFVGRFRLRKRERECTLMIAAAAIICTNKLMRPPERNDRSLFALLSASGAILQRIRSDPLGSVRFRTHPIGFKRDASVQLAK